MSQRPANFLLSNCGKYHRQYWLTHSRVNDAQVRIRHALQGDFVDVSMKWGFCDDFLRCISVKVGLEMRVFHDLFTHLNRAMVFTLRNNRISTMSSSGINTGVNGGLDWHWFLIGRISIGAMMLKTWNPNTKRESKMNVKLKICK